jgi:hypothetical protein
MKKQGPPPWGMNQVGILAPTPAAAYDMLWLPFEMNNLRLPLALERSIARQRFNDMWWRGLGWTGWR